MPTLRVILLTAIGLALLPAGASAAGPRITYYFGLERPEGAARQAFFAAGDPASPAYRRFLAPAQVKARYGATAATRRAFRREARERGLRARIDASGVFARLSGPVGRFERVFGVRIVRSFNNDVFAHDWTVKGDRRLKLPAAFKPLVRDVVATYSRSTRKPPARAAATPPKNEGTWTGGCEAARKTGSYSFGQVRHAYGIDGAGTGVGASVAVLNAGEGVPRADRRAYAKCFGLAEVKTRTLLTDGQAKPFGRGSFEPQEDLALVRGMAPRLDSVTFTQVWLAEELWFLGPAQVLAAGRLPDSLSISYGVCEPIIRGRQGTRATRAGARLMDALLVRVGLAGVSAFAATGDFGSTCNGQPHPGIAWPASSPFVTAVGGTRLTVGKDNLRTSEVVWNDLRWLATDAGGGAGGGGYARFSPQPPYQAGLGLRDRRAAPDIAAHASLLPGWPVNLGRFWEPDGGTSAATPLSAAGFAIVSARERAAGRPPLGNVNGLLYDVRATAPDLLFDVVEGDNGYTRTVPARHARPGYDLASGLGVPRFRDLADALG